MTKYVITYDLSQPGRNYNALYGRIKSYGTYAQITESTWIIASTQTAAEVRDNLGSTMDNNDKLFVSVVSVPAAWIGLDDSIATWLQQNL